MPINFQPSEVAKTVVQAALPEKSVDKITPLTGQAAQQIFAGVQALPEEWPFSRTASVKDDLAPVNARVKDLWKSKDNITSNQMKAAISELRKGFRNIEKELQDLEFDAEFGVDLKNFGRELRSAAKARG